ncbi:MAG: hypothetical protein OEY41_01135 [Acidimicrobiia bacterium]|nr:hypothetical protein [Acidimicrobiia bacterium]
MRAANLVPSRAPRYRRPLAVVALAGLLVAACGSSDPDGGASGGEQPQALTGGPTGTLRLGYFPTSPTPWPSSPWRTARSPMPWGPASTSSPTP